MNTFTKTLILCLLLIFTAACSNNVAKSKKYFRIPVPQTSAPTELKPVTLVIKRPKSLSILGGRPMVATQDDESLVQLSHNFWIESPKVLLQDILQVWASQHWQVATYQTPNEANYQILESRILAFEKYQNQAKVSIEFLLYDEDYQLIYHHQFEQFHQMDGEGYRAFTKAVSKAIESILNQLSDQL